MIKLRIEAKGFDSIQTRYRFAANKTYILANPKLREVGQRMASSVKEEISGKYDPKGFEWNGVLMGSVGTFNVSEREIDVVQSDQGNFILYGTSPRDDLKAPPEFRGGGIVDWCMSKFGLTEKEAFAPALAIVKKGILSDSRAHYPGGARGFNYPDYIVNDKEKMYLERSAEDIAGLIVRYLDTEK